MNNNNQGIKKMSSQKEISKRLNLSQSTVSRALNNDSSIPLHTRVLVKKCAMDIGYQVRRYTSREKEQCVDRNGQKVLALIHQGDKPDEKFYSLLIEMIQGLIQGANYTNTKLIIKEIYNMDNAKQIVSQYSNNVIGAMLILRHDDEMVDLFSANFPCISFNHHYNNLNIKVVEPQQAEAFAMLYDYMYLKGHRKIGFFTIKNSNDFAFTRYSGFMRGAFKNSALINENWVINIIPGQKQLELDEAIERIIELNQKDGVSAFICTSGAIVKTIILKLQDRGIKIPEDISFASFDDLTTRAGQTYLLTGAQADYEKMAKTAISILKTPQLFSEIKSICCAYDFQKGNTVAEKNI